MTCEKFNDYIMLYHEGRLKPRQAIALHKHLENCPDCRELFLVMDSAEEFTDEPREGFVEAVMAKVSDLPAYERVTNTKPRVDWLRVAGSFYALALAVVLIIFYNTDLIQIPQTGGDWFYAITDNMFSLLSGFGHFPLVVAVVPALAFVFMLQKEKVKKHDYSGH